MSYLEPGVDTKLFQCSFEVVRSYVGVETGLSKVILSPPTVSCTIYVSFFWGHMLQMMRKYVTFASWGTLYLCMKKQVLVPCMSPIPWKNRPISFETPFLHLSSSETLMRCQYSCVFSVLGQMTALALPGCNVRLTVTWSMTAQSSPTGRTRGAGLLGL